MVKKFRLTASVMNIIQKTMSETPASAPQPETSPTESTPEQAKKQLPLLDLLYTTRLELVNVKV